MESIERYHRLLSADPAAAVEQAAWLEEAFAEAGVTYGGQPMRSFLRPHLVGRAAWNRLREAGRRLLELAARAARQAFDGDVARLCAYLGTPAAEVPWVAIDPGPPDVLLSRLDGFLTPGGPRFIEINSDAPAGFGYGDRMAGVFERLPVFQRFAQDVRLSYLPSAPPLVDAVLAAAAARGVTGGTVAIVDWADVKTRPDQGILREAFAARGVRCLLADPREMELAAGALMVGGDHVQVVYRRALLPELVARADEARALLAAYREGGAVFVNSFRCRLSEDKAFLGLLGDEEFPSLLTEEERTFVSRRVPWTRRLAERRTFRDERRVDLVPHVLERRSELVLKPAHGYGGQSVLLGEETSSAEWEAAVGQGLQEAWVVQERVPIPVEPFPVCEGGVLAFEPMYLNANPFYAAGAEVGGVTRASRSPVVNVSAGGGSVPTFVVGWRRV